MEQQQQQYSLRIGHDGDRWLEPIPIDDGPSCGDHVFTYGHGLYNDDDGYGKSVAGSDSGSDIDVPGHDHPIE